MPARTIQSLIERLPAVRGRISENAPLSGITWFRVGGPAEILFRPADREDLFEFMRAKPLDVPVTVIGVGSNLLVRDGGIPGVVIRLGRAFVGIEFNGETVVAGAAGLDLNVAIACRNRGVAGLEFLSGVPGTIGGALCMNAGAYGREMNDVVVAAEALDPTGTARTLTPADLGFGYRRSAVPADWVFLSATMKGEPGDRDAIARRMAEIGETRKASQPIRSRTGGSTFKNPANDPAGGRAWELIDRAGCRGLTVGGAKVSEVHCNFLINTGTATAGDLESLGEEVRRRVREHCGVVLEWEIRRIGVASMGARAGDC